MKDKNGIEIQVGDLLANQPSENAEKFRVVCISADNLTFMVRKRSGIMKWGSEKLEHMYVCGHIRPVDSNMKRGNIHEYDLTNVDFSNEDLTYYNFEGIDLHSVLFHGAILNNCRFSDSEISHCIFDESYMRRTVFTNVYIHDSCFRRSHLNYVCFSSARIDKCIFYHLYSYEDCECHFTNCDMANNSFNLTDFTGFAFHYSVLNNTDLRGANISNSYFEESELKNSIANNRTIGYYMACPEEGAFVGWKKCGTDIVELLIPDDAKRSSSTTRKCRCSKAIVLSIKDINGIPRPSFYVAQSRYDPSFVYKVGKTVEVPDFDENRWNECSTGIHFFVTKQEAICYRMN